MGSNDLGFVQDFSNTMTSKQASHTHANGFFNAPFLQDESGARNGTLHSTQTVKNSFNKTSRNFGKMK